MINTDPGGWRSAPTQPGYCPHGGYPCTGNPDAGLPPCPGSDHHYCAHGFDQRRRTSEGEPLCPYCRGVTAPRVNPETYSRRRIRRTPE